MIPNIAKIFLLKLCIVYIFLLPLYGCKQDPLKQHCKEQEVLQKDFKKMYESWQEVEMKLEESKRQQEIVEEMNQKEQRMIEENRKLRENLDKPEFWSKVNNVFKDKEGKKFELKLFQ